MEGSIPFEAGPGQSAPGGRRTRPPELHAERVGVGNVTVYGTSVTQSDVRMSDSGSLENKGVLPDELLLPTPEDLSAGRDPVLARAVELAGGSLTPEQAGKLYSGK
jgi:hypothetical protein